MIFRKNIYDRYEHTEVLNLNLNHSFFPFPKPKLITKHRSTCRRRSPLAFLSHLLRFGHEHGVHTPKPERAETKVSNREASANNTITIFGSRALSNLTTTAVDLHQVLVRVRAVLVVQLGRALVAHVSPGPEPVVGTARASWTGAASWPWVVVRIMRGMCRCTGRSAVRMASAWAGLMDTDFFAVSSRGLLKCLCLEKLMLCVWGFLRSYCRNSVELSKVVVRGGVNSC